MDIFLLCKNTLKSAQNYRARQANPTGRTKPVGFQALGFTRDNWEDLTSQIRFDEAKAIFINSDEYGQKFHQTIDIRGGNGKTIPVKFVWMRHPDNIVRLITGSDLPGEIIMRFAPHDIVKLTRALDKPDMFGDEPFKYFQRMRKVLWCYRASRSKTRSCME